MMMVEVQAPRHSEKDLGDDGGVKAPRTSVMMVEVQAPRHSEKDLGDDS